MSSQIDAMGLDSTGFWLEILKDLEAERRRRIELEAAVRHLSNQKRPSQCVFGTATNEKSGDKSTEIIPASDSSIGAKMGKRWWGVSAPNDEVNNCGSDEDSAVSFKADEVNMDHTEVLNALVVDELQPVGLCKEEMESALRRASAEAALAERRSNFQISSLKAERDGLVEVVNALIDSNQQSDAVSVANLSISQNKPTLPLHIVQMLETVPWDQRARRHTHFVEEVYEWQYYTKKNGWTKDIKDFPNCFLKSLPRRKPDPTPIEIQNDHDDFEECDSALGLSGGALTRSNKVLACPRTQHPPNLHESSTSAPARLALNFSSGCVLTNYACNVRYNLENGFPLPEEGTWNWVGGWRVNSAQNALDCDSGGWSYSDDIKHLVIRNKSLCRNTPYPASKEEQDKFEQLIAQHPKHHLSHGVVRPFRFRRWTRLRVLVAYPCIGEKSKHFLSLSAQNAGLAVSISKLSNQLLDTQIKLAEREERIACAKELTSQVQLLQETVLEKDERIKDLERRLAFAEKQVKEAARHVSFATNDKNATPNKFVPRMLFKSASEIITSMGAIRAESPPSTPSLLPRIVTTSVDITSSKTLAGQRYPEKSPAAVVDIAKVEVDPAVCSDDGASASIGSVTACSTVSDASSDERRSKLCDEEREKEQDGGDERDAVSVSSILTTNLSSGSDMAADCRSHSQTHTKYKVLEAFPELPFRFNVLDDGTRIGVEVVSLH